VLTKSIIAGIFLASLGGGVYYAGDDSVYTYLNKKVQIIFPPKQDFPAKPKPSKSVKGTAKSKASSGMKYTFFETLLEPSADNYLGLIADSQNEKKTSPPKDIINQAAERPTQREALKTAKPSKPNKSTGIPTALSQDVNKEFTVQVSSFQELDRARDMRGRLSKKGYSAFYLKVDIPEKGVWYRVYLGTYSTRQEAKMAAGMANIIENLPAVVRRTG